MSVSVIERGTHQFYNLLKCAPNIYTKSKYIRYRNITRTPPKNTINEDMKSSQSKTMTYRNYSIVVNSYYGMT
jgi:hypothetical protein